MARTYLFVDTNVFLELYHYPRENLAQLRSLSEHIGADGIRLLLPQHVTNELERNREKRLKASADTFRQTSHPGQIPEHMLDYPQTVEYKRAIDAASKARNAMINQAATDASKKLLPADKVLAELFAKADHFVDDDEVFARALKRSQKANPPGKPDSVGDQYNWETLLAEAPEADLHIVSLDGDYFSTLNNGLPHPFLAREWKERKNAVLHVYKGIRPFLDRYLVTVEIDELAAWAEEQLGAKEQETTVAAVILEVIGAAPDPEKESAIDAVVNSRSFAMTHKAIARLEQFRATLTGADATRLLEAAIENREINWIASDDDIYAFFSGLLFEHIDDVDAGLHDAASEIFGMSNAAEKPENE